MSINSRQKGARFERELANLLKTYGYKARRGQQFCGANGDADVVGIDGLHIEAKHVEALNIFKAMEQSRNDAKENEIPVVIHKKNRTPILVTMDIDNFIKIWKGETNGTSKRNVRKQVSKN